MGQSTDERHVQCGINQLPYGCALSSLSRKMPGHGGYILIVSFLHPNATLLYNVLPVADAQ